MRNSSKAKHGPMEMGNDDLAARAPHRIDLSAATDGLRRARAELKKARAFYEHVRQEAAQRVEAVRKTTMGDLIDGAMGLVKRHPAPSLFGAAVVGFLLGRRLKR